MFSEIRLFVWSILFIFFLVSVCYQNALTHAQAASGAPDSFSPVFQLFISHFTEHSVVAVLLFSLADYSQTEADMTLFLRSR